MSPLMIVLRELSKYKLDLVGVQEVRWEGGGPEPMGKYTFFYERGMRIMISIQVDLCISESYQWLRKLSLLVIECHM
jgi:hypothetical protein